MQSYLYAAQGIWRCIVCIAIISVLIVGCSPSTPPILTALEKMELAFVGSPSQSEIKALADRVLTNFKQAPSEETYTVLGNVVVRMRQLSKKGVTEMQVLRCMSAMGGAMGTDYVAAAAFCAAGLES